MSKNKKGAAKVATERGTDKIQSLFDDLEPNKPFPRNLGEDRSLFDLIGLSEAEREFREYPDPRRGEVGRRAPGQLNADAPAGMWRANVIAADPIHVWIICPICGEIHRHGSNRDPHRDDYGSRVPHCSYGGPIDKIFLDLGEYRLVPSKYTLRYDSVQNVSNAAMLKRYRRGRA